MIRSILFHLVLTFITASSLNAQCELDSISIFVSDTIILDFEVNKIVIGIEVEKVTEVADLNQFLTANNIEIEETEELFGRRFMTISDQTQSTIEEIMAYVKSNPIQIAYLQLNSNLSEEQIKKIVEAKIRIKANTQLKLLNKVNNCDFSELERTQEISMDVINFDSSGSWNLNRAIGWTAYPPLDSIKKEKSLLVFNYEIIYK